MRGKTSYTDIRPVSDTGNGNGADHGVFGNAFITGCPIGEGCDLGANAYIGDANCSGGIDISDAIYILTYLFSSGPSCCLMNMDINDSNSIDISDPIKLLGYLFAGEDMKAPDGAAIMAEEDGCSLYPLEELWLPGEDGEVLENPCEAPCTAGM